jgi:hypothetical protein
MIGTSLWNSSFNHGYDINTNIDPSPLMFNRKKRRMKKNHIKVKLYRRKDTVGNTESVIVEVNLEGSIEKRFFATQKAAYEYIETLKEENG